MNILTLNAGSSSLKFRLFRLADGAEDVLAEGNTESGGDTHAALQKIVDQCRPLGVDAVGHRLVHGGARFSAPVQVTPDVLDGLRGLRDWDPLHNPAEVALIEDAQKLLPDAPAVAAFDTAFHQTLPEVAWRYALPRDLCDRLGLRRYGFHGLSYEYVSGRLLERLSEQSKRGPDGTRLILCHLGNGASVCAVRGGISVDTSMGMTPLEGLAMGTRAGDVDPGLLLYLLRTQGMTADALDTLLNKDSGLKGLSGASADVRDLAQAARAGDAHAEMALAVFASRVSKYVGAYAAVLGGVDALAFTGGIGEHSAEVRSRVCRTLGFLGLRLDDARNEGAGGADALLSPDDAPVPIWVIPTDEERQIARETFRVLSA